MCMFNSRVEPASARREKKAIINKSKESILIIHKASLENCRVLKIVVHGPDPEICIFVAPPSQLWFDGISGFPCHIKSHFHLLSFAQPEQ